MKVERIESTPEQIEAAILGGPYASPCRFIYALEVCPELDKGEHKHWPQRIPVHAVIHALGKDSAHYSDLLQEERTRRQEAEAALTDLTEALRKVYKAMTS